MGIHRNFDDFRKQYLKYSEKLYYGFEQLWHEDWSAYDAFVCGSDQIWSPRSDEQLSAFFLQFAPFKCLRIAYAPSFGRSVLLMEYQQKLNDLLQYFDAVSVREKEGIDFCNKAGVDSQFVCDPTILLKDSDYRKLTINSERDNHIFCYLINWDTLFPEEDVKKLVPQYAGVHYFCIDGQEQIFEYEKEQALDQLHYKEPNNQICFRCQDAVDQFLRYVESEK